MQGLMQNFPVVIPGLLEHAERNHATTEILTRRLEGDLHCHTFLDMTARSRQLARGLHRLGVSAGDALPIGMAGKVQKNLVREHFSHYKLPRVA